MGIDRNIIITLLPISILFAIALSPESLHTLTANSVKKAIPVIFKIINKNWLFIPDLSDIDLIRSITYVSLSITKTSISIPHARDM